MFLSIYKKIPILYTPKGISKSDIFIQPMAGVKMADF